MKKDKPLDTIDGESLINLPLQPTRFILSDLIPQGLHLLAGAPKSGKSWLVLWLCLQIAGGKEVWDFETEQGTTLYLCLEDSLGRIKNRLLDITDNAPPNIYFSTFAENIENGLIKQIERFVTENKNTNLIVIDTLQKVRGDSNAVNPYASDYRDLAVLKEFADKHQIAVLLVHHLRKMNDDDPMNMISGTTGMTGVVDGIYVLKKDKRSDKKAKLFCTGRDIEYTELELEFDSTNHVWDLISQSNEQKKETDRILEQIKDFISLSVTFTGTATELADAIEEKTGVHILPSPLAKKIIQSQTDLKTMGIGYTGKRSGNKREHSLFLINDTNDVNDGKNDIEPVPYLPSQASQPSQNVAPVCDPLNRRRGIIA